MVRNDVGLEQKGLIQSVLLLKLYSDVRKDFLAKAWAN